MARFSIKVNRIVLENEIQKILRTKPRYLLNEARQVAEDALEGVKRRVITRFDRHEVTRELRAGPNTAGGVLPFGNLYSFLGFQRGFDPTGKLRNLIEQGITMEDEPTYDRRLKRYYFRVRRVSDDRIIEETSDDLDWGGFESWVYAIEEGISNISHYLFLHGATIDNSRSGPAIQKKTEVHPGADFSGTPYLSDIWDYLQQTLSRPVN
jgi:hypothetical protein